MVAAHRNPLLVVVAQLPVAVEVQVEVVAAMAALLVEVDPLLAAASEEVEVVAVEVLDEVVAADLSLVEVVEVYPSSEAAAEVVEAHTLAVVAPLLAPVVVLAVAWVLEEVVLSPVVVELAAEEEGV